jgi:spore maturation protein CgeB
MASFSSSLVSAYWNGAATYDRGINRAIMKGINCFLSSAIIGRG